MRLRPAVAGLCAALFVAGCGAEPTPTPKPACPTEAPTSTGAQAILEDAATATFSMEGAVEGEIVVELLPDAAPISTANFVALARCGFYDGLWFHRVLSGFVIQAGDPETRDADAAFPEIGRGGPGYEFEIEPTAEGLDYEAYTVAMANNSIAQGSQFFITLADLRGRLPLDYTIFGRVIGGAEVVDAIAALPVNDPRVGIPLEIPRISSVVIGSGEGSPDGTTAP